MFITKQLDLEEDSRGEWLSGGVGGSQIWMFLMNGVWFAKSSCTSSKWAERLQNCGINTKRNRGRGWGRKIQHRGEGRGWTSYLAEGRGWTSYLAEGRSWEDIPEIQ